MATASSSAVPDPLPDPAITTAYVSTTITAPTPSNFSFPVAAISAFASESDLPTSVSSAPVPTTSSAPTFGLSISVSTTSSTPVGTPSLSTSASPASASSKKDDPGPTAFPESVTDQTTARAYLKKVMTKQISTCEAKLFEIGAVPECKQFYNHFP